RLAVGLADPSGGHVVVVLLTEGPVDRTLLVVVDEQGRGPRLGGGERLLGERTGAALHQRDLAGHVTVVGRLTARGVVHGDHRERRRETTLLCGRTVFHHDDGDLGTVRHELLRQRLRVREREFLPGDVESGLFQFVGDVLGGGVEALRARRAVAVVHVG